LRPYRSASPPNAEAPIKMPNSEDAATTPFGRIQGELLAHERQGHASGEDHHPFEELAGGGQPPD
jgi:hypothetical protein